MTLRTITILFALTIGLVLTACERSNTKPPKQNTEPPGHSQAKPPSENENVLTTNDVNVQYADVVKIVFRRLRYGDFQSFRDEIPEDLSAADITVIEGQADDLFANSNEIRFSTPTDSGGVQFLKLLVKLPERDIIIPVAIESSFPLGVGLMVDTDDDGNIMENPPMLVVTGLGPNNTLLPNEMTFHVPGAPELAPDISRAFIVIPRAKDRIISLRPYWTYDQTHNRFVITKQNMERLLLTLPSGAMMINIGISAKRSDFNYPYGINVYKGQAKLSGVLIDHDGRPMTELAGRPVAIHGQGDNNPLRRVAIADSEGRFSVTDLMPGTYIVELLDPADDYYGVNAYAIYPDSTQISVKLKVRALKTSEPIRSGQVSRLNHEKDSWQDGTPPSDPERRSLLKSRAALPPECESFDSESQSAIYQAISGSEEISISCQIRAEIPQGTRQVGITVSVSSKEYPDFTQIISEFNDFWSYEIEVPGGDIRQTGSVNDSHYSQGTISQRYCRDVSKLTVERAYLLTGQLLAKNVGDSIYPTGVKAVISPHCNGMLTVAGAALANSNQAGYRVIAPVNVSEVRGNSAGHYLSIPLNEAYNNWGLEMVVNYSPADIEITQVRMGLLANGELVMAEREITDYISQRAPGELTFNNLIIPQFASGRFAGKASLLLELTGTSNDGTSSTMISDVHDGAVTFNGSRRFTPLFLANEIFSDRRYGARDNGGDSWARREAFDWLTNNVYRFDDITALHAAQLANGRSVMQHAGHSDGRQIDLRYADGNGGYSDTYGGQGNGVAILRLLNNAKREVDRGILNGPNLAHAQRWIRDNRSLLENESVNADWLYAGQQWLRGALLGLFPDGQTAIPEVGGWDDMPGNINFARDHLHHWHMSVGNLHRD